MQEILRALKVPSFGRLAATYALNETADWFASIALAVLVYAHTGDALATTALFVCNRFLPAFLVPALASRADAWPTARLLGSLYVLEALILTGLAVSTTAFLLPLVLVAAFADGTIASTARAVTRSATATLMEPKGLLREGNATLNLSFSAMNAIAPVVAGVFVAGVGTGAVLATAAALFLVQAVTIGGARELSPGEPETAPWRESLGEGLAYVRGNAMVRALLATQSAVMILLFMIPPVEIVYAQESLGAGDVGYGALLATWGVGMVLGGLIFAAQRGRAILALIVAGTVIQALSYIGLGASPTLLVACCVSVFGGVGNGMHWVAVVTAVQEATAERFQSRVAGLLESMITAVPGVGFLLGGAITSIFDPRVALVVSGTGVLVFGFVTLVCAGRASRATVRLTAEPEPEPVAA